MNIQKELEKCREILEPHLQECRLEFNMDDIQSKSRKRKLVLVRTLIVKIMVERNATLKQIGSMLGGRDHSTIIKMRDNLHSMLMLNDYYYRILYNIVASQNIDEKIKYHKEEITKLKKLKDK